jgi:exodeoxyribonuclease VII large subunit
LYFYKYGFQNKELAGHPDMHSYFADKYRSKIVHCQTMNQENISPSEVAKTEGVLSVEQLNKRIRGAIESQFFQVWVKGELSNFKAHSSGHFYFSLKDAQSQIKAVMFKGYNSKLKFKPQDGMEVLLRGKVTVYEPRGEYQIVCDTMEPVGAGALQKAFEQLKDKLKKEGLFEQARKRTLPPLPKHVAIVTSPTGAAIQDILNILKRRARGLEITIVPSIVQGEAAAPILREAFIKATRIPGIDVIIIGRGGGSMEDLWCFNDEQLVRLMAASPIPVISAVGHEVDFTICDFVADLRAPTPSAAAELVVKSADELIQKVKSLQKMLVISIDRVLKTNKQKFIGFAHRLIDPKRKIQDFMLKNDDLQNRLVNAVQRFILRKRDHLALALQKLGTPDSIIKNKTAKLQMYDLKLRNQMDKLLDFKRSKLYQKMAVLDSLSPLKVVDRGYSLVQSPNGDLIKSVNQLKENDPIEIRFAQGKASALVTKLFN